LEQPARAPIARVKAAARLVVLGLPLVEEDPVAGLQPGSARLRAHQHVPGAGAHLLDPAHQDAAVPGVEAVDQLLVIRAPEEPMGEAAREAVAQLLLLAARERERPPLQ